MSAKQRIYRVFTRKYGILLHPDATDYVLEFAERHGLTVEQVADLTEQLASHYAKATVDDAMVDGQRMQRLFSELVLNPAGSQEQHGAADDVAMDDIDALSQTIGATTLGNPRDHLHVVSAYDLPRWRYDAGQGKYLRQTEKPALMAGVMAKIQMYNDRASIIKQRLLRNECFQPAAFHSGGGRQEETLQLTSIKSLRGRVGKTFLLFGMLSQLEEGRLFLEERDGSVELDLSDCTYSLGLFTENSFALVSGMLTDDQVFKVGVLAQPPVEDIQTTKRMLGNVDFLGLDTNTADAAMALRIEKANQEASIVFLSDLHLDLPKTLTHLKAVLAGYAQAATGGALPPLAFVMMGSFVSRPLQVGSEDADQYRDNFGRLAELIAQHHILRDRSQFIFVPGPNDPWSGDTLPQRPIPESFTERMRTRLPTACFTSNPCRIRYCSQDIVVLRSNLLARMRRHCAVPPQAAHGELAQQMLQTVIAQAHLTPMPLHRQPVFWELDHTLRLYRTPDVLVLGDSASPYHTTLEGCHCFNPGSFPNNAQSWYDYRPARHAADFSALPR
ncbi:DNA polymerase alpha/epsilon subunit B-domain-containing protein [Thamnocephalis sphaerospora]|uniref:DNA polymerase epsilon subunit n=1 Tax=Thamnocephalis sphaerospora TaxID=78915 RepID=A0A4P9XXQ6_9FUNG|nr:DNA polymerase alpha/epsilon subunit B-domain-containing protein [Thamnocephalis sphaerospora]|eukprot:RKP11176.1 DNA polymerase alpha/epsilon subunit B-domain-containing protein [Thamnocephalis sphaerospora]